VTDRTELRRTFDSAATRYHGARPRYPHELFAVLATYLGNPAELDVLEVGPATGIATIPLAERGWRVTGIELGADLADQARANTAHLAGVEIVTGSFDVWEPPAWGGFDLVVAATSWHWLDPTTRYQRAHRHLRPGGVLAYWSATHVLPDDGDPIFVELQDIYDEIGESRGDWLRPGELPVQVGDIDQTGLFGDVEAVQFDWEVTYDADGYFALLDTFSGHIAMRPAQRARLYGEIRRRLSERPDGRVRRHWGAALHLARRPQRA